MPSHPTRRAFTLIELLVVITIIVVLLALLAPALDKAIEQTVRAICASNQRTIAQGTVMYGMHNRKDLFACRGREMMIAFDPKGTTASFHSNSADDALVDWPAAIASAGLATDKQPVPEGPYSSPPPTGYVNNLPGKMWDCPGRRDWKSYWNYNPAFMALGSAEPAVMFVSYAYYGGLAVWENPLMSPNPQSNLSPRKLGDPGDRTLITDATTKTAQVWGGPANYAFQIGGSPSHLDEGPYPAGHNQAYLDGSAGWVEADRLLALHSWNNDPNEIYFFWQQDIGLWSPDANGVKFSTYK